MGTLFDIFRLSDSVLLILALLWAFANEIPLNLLQEAGLPEASVAVQAKHLRWAAGGDCISDFLDEGSATKLVNQSRLVTMQAKLRSRGHQTLPPSMTSQKRRMLA